MSWGLQRVPPGCSLAALFLAVGCEEPAGPRPGETVRLTIVEQPATALVAATVSITVKVSGSGDRALAGVLVTAEPADSSSGSGSSATSSANGQASLQWTLGPRAVPQSLRISSPGHTSLAIATTTPLAGPPVKFDTTSLPPLSVGDTQPLPASGALDQYDNPVAGALVWSALTDHVTIVAGNAIGMRAGPAPLRATLGTIAIATSLSVQPFRVTRVPTPRPVLAVAGEPGSLVAATATGILWQTATGWVFDSVPDVYRILAAPLGQPTWVQVVAGPITAPSSVRLLRYTGPNHFAEVALPAGVPLVADPFGDTVVMNGGTDTVWVGPGPWRVVTGRTDVHIRAQNPRRFVGFSIGQLTVPPFAPLLKTARFNGVAWQHDTAQTTIWVNYRTARSPERTYRFEWVGGTGGSFQMKYTRIDVAGGPSRAESSCSFGAIAPCWRTMALTGDGVPFQAGYCDMRCPKPFVGFMRFTDAGDVTFQYAIGAALSPGGNLTALDGGPPGRTTLAVADSRGFGLLLVYALP